MATAPKFYEGQEFHNPQDPSAPVLVFRKGKFLPKSQDVMQAGSAPQNAFGDAQTMLSDIDALKARVRGGPLGNTGMIGGIEAGNNGPWKGIPGTPGYNLSKDLDTIKARLMFKNLADMRASSPTGGALGQVSDTEGKLLASTEGSLDVGQPADQLSRNLDRMRSAYARKTPGLTPENPVDLTYGGSREQIPRGAYYKDPQGNIRLNQNGDAGNPIVNRQQKNDALKAKSAQAKGFRILGVEN